MDITYEQAIVEAVLFASGEPVSLKNIADVISKDENIANDIMMDLMEEYLKERRGLKIIQIEDSFQMCTNPEYFSYIKNLYSVPQKKKLSQALLETLAIIAYKQPITKQQIEYIRGVNSDNAVNNLIKYNLVEEKGRVDIVGKPIIFGTTEEFLKYFGFKNLDEMPLLETEDTIRKAIDSEFK